MDAGKIGSGNPVSSLNIYQIVTFDTLAGEAGFEPTSTVLETAELPLFYSPVKEDTPFDGSILLVHSSENYSTMAIT